MAVRFSEDDFVFLWKIYAIESVCLQVWARTHVLGCHVDKSAGISYLTSGQAVFQGCLVKQTTRAVRALQGLDLCDPITPMPPGPSRL